MVKIPLLFYDINMGGIVMKDNLAQMLGFVFIALGATACILIFLLSPYDTVITITVALTVLLSNLALGAILSTLGKIQGLLEYMIDND